MSVSVLQIFIYNRERFQFKCFSIFINIYTHIYIYFFLVTIILKKYTYILDSTQTRSAPPLTRPNQRLSSQQVALYNILEMFDFGFLFVRKIRFLLVASAFLYRIHTDRHIDLSRRKTNKKRKGGKGK